MAASGGAVAVAGGVPTHLGGTPGLATPRIA